MVFILFLLSVWFLFALGVGVLAGTWDRNGLLWTGMAIVISPLLALVLLLALGKSSGSGTYCPDCKAPINEGDDPCPNCGVALDWSEA